MNSTALQEARPQIDLATRLLRFRQTIAQRCANILYGCYTGKRKVCIEIPAVLTGVSLIGAWEREYLKNEICVSLLKLLGDEYITAMPTINVIVRNNHTGTHQETYLRIAANITKS